MISLMTKKLVGDVIGIGMSNLSFLCPLFMDVAFIRTSFSIALVKWIPPKNHTDHISISLHDFLNLEFCIIYMFLNMLY